MTLLKRIKRLLSLRLAIFKHGGFSSVLLFILRQNEPAEEGTVIDASLINLPWATLVTLASGYIGYFIAKLV